MSIMRSHLFLERQCRKMEQDVFGLETLLDDWDATDAWPLAPQTSENSSSDDVRASVTRSTLCRRRQREELMQLRSETVELEQQLDRLRGEPGNTLSSVPKSVWQRIAEHRRELRLEAQTENARLRRLVDAQQKVSAKLEKVIRASQSVQEDCEQELRRKRSCQRPVSRCFGEGRLDVVLCSSVQDMSIAALHHDVFAMESVDCERVNIKTDASGRGVMESIYCQVFPFDLKTTTTAMWRCYNTTNLDVAGGSFSAKSTSSGQLVVFLEFPVEIHGMDVVLWSQCQLRRVEESADRVLIVWEDVSESNRTPRSDHTASRRVQMKFDACIGVEPLSCQYGPSTVMRACAYSRPGSQRSVVDDPVRAIGDQFVEVVQVFNRSFTQRIEAFLLEETLKKLSK